MTRDAMIKRMVNHLEATGVLDKDRYSKHDEQVVAANKAIKEFLNRYTLVRDGRVY